MLHLVTGTPGQGKTLNTIKYVTEKKAYEGKDVYYHGINGLKPEHGWIELSEDEAFKWFELPAGSVIIFDEAYTIFPVRNSAKKPPEHVERMARYRHQGYIIFMICQKVAGQLDPFIRGLINRHQHYSRVMGSKLVHRFEWPSCQQNPDGANARKGADKTPLTLDKKYFDIYHSAEEHNFKLTLPKHQLMMLGVALGLFMLFAVLVFNRFTSRGDDLPGNDVEVVEAQSVNGVVSSTRIVQPSSTPTPSTYLDRHRPLVESVEWTAPIYAELWRARSYPIPTGCHKIGDLPCRCNTDQGTNIVEITEGQCMHILQHGFYDYRKDPVLNPQRFSDAPSGAVIGGGAPVSGR